MGNTPKWKPPIDSRKEGMKYPYYSMVQSPSGSGYIIDDTKGHESMTFYHRSGSLIQMKEDGSLVIINQKDAYQVTFGDSNMLVTGGYNITVNGGATLKVEGDYDMTVHGNAKQTIEGNMDTIINGDSTTAIKGSQEVLVGGDMAQQVVGTMELVADQATFGGNDLKIKALGTAKFQGVTVTMDATASYAITTPNYDLDSADIDIFGASIVLNGTVTDIYGSPVNINSITQIGN